MNFNSITFGGQCARAPIQRTFGKESRILAEFVVCNRESSEPIFIEVIAFDAQAEKALAYLQRNDYVSVEGKILQECWVDSRSSEKRCRIKIAARKVFLKMDVER